MIQLINCKPGAQNTLDNLGISIDRAKELSAKMDQLINTYRQRQAVVHVFDSWNDIGTFCNTQNEFIYCVVSHTSWMANRGTPVVPAMSDADKAVYEKQLITSKNILERLSDAHEYGIAKSDPTVNEVELAIEFLCSTALLGIKNLKPQQ